MPILMTDFRRRKVTMAPTLEAAMTLLVARYPEAVFSDIKWTEPMIWVWPSNTACQDPDPDRAVAWLQRLDDGQREQAQSRR